MITDVSLMFLMQQITMKTIPTQLNIY